MQVSEVVLLRLFSRSVGVLILVPLIFRVEIVKYFDEKGDWNTFKLCSLTLLVDAIFLKVEDISHISEFLLHF